MCQKIKAKQHQIIITMKLKHFTEAEFDSIVEQIRVALAECVVNYGDAEYNEWIMNHFNEDDFNDYAEMYAEVIDNSDDFEALMDGKDVSHYGLWWVCDNFTHLVDEISAEYEKEMIEAV